MRISDWSSDVCSSDLYNVPNNGVVLNNGTRDPISRQSQLAGQVTSNLNLDRAAKVILNDVVGRSEERRVGKEWVSTCRSRRSPTHYKKTTAKQCRGCQDAIDDSLITILNPK